MVEVRRVRAEEWRKFKQLRLEALKDTPIAFVERYEESIEKPDEFWQERTVRGAEGDTRVMFVAVADGELVGKASCFVEDDITDRVSAHVVGVYVTPAWRGREDVAARLLAEAIAWGREDKEADQVRLFVTDGNERAAAFYRRIGFVASGDTIPYPHDPEILEHEMLYTPVMPTTP